MKLTNFQNGLIIVLVAFFFLGGIIFVNRILLGDAFSKEEAQHALYGLSLSKDLRVFDWGNFWYDTQRQMFWPFFHSWILAPVFLLLGPGYISARFLSFIIFFATLILMYDVSCRLSEKNGWKIGTLSAALAFTSPMMVRFASENTLEGLGALIFLAAFYFYTLSEETKLTIDYALLGLIMGLSLYTNYLYAYLMLPAFIVMTLGKLGPIILEAFNLKRQGEKAALPFFWWAYRKMVVLVVLAILVAAWFLTAAFSRKILLFMQAIFRYAGGETVAGFWPNLFFYPQAIINQYAFSPWLGLLLFLSLFLPFISFKYLQLGKLFTFIWTVIILATLTIPTKAPQFIYIVAPFIFIIFSAAVFYIIDFASVSRKQLAAGLSLLIIPALFSLPRLEGLYFPSRPAENMAHVLDYFKNGVLPRNPVALSVNLQHLNPEGAAFHFRDWNAPVLADPIIGEDEMLRSSQYLLSIEIDGDSPYQREILDDSIHRWNAFLSEKLRLGEVKEHSSRRFETLGLTAKIFEKVSR